ncbi:MAG: hypothetical protein J7J99_08090 [Thermoprotei archaeon]|nr:hypothetical protein [Thermoprotei archaeon]
MLWFFKKRKQLPYPTEVRNNVQYYVVSPSQVKDMNGANVKFSGVVTERPEIVYYTAGFPLSLENAIEENHGHETLLTVSGVRTIFKGIAFIKKGDSIVVYGKVEDGHVDAHIIETEYAIYRRE